MNVCILAVWNDALAQRIAIRKLNSGTESSGAIYHHCVCVRACVRVCMPASLFILGEFHNEQLISAIGISKLTSTNEMGESV